MKRWKTNLIDHLAWVLSSEHVLEGNIRRKGRYVWKTRKKKKAASGWHERILEIE